MRRQRSEFHSHSTLSDGVLLPMELIRRADALRYRSIAITDHAGASVVDRIIRELRRDCEHAEDLGILALPGVEITHVPPRRIATVARMARKAGAKVVVVHGETLVEPVVPGTNLAAVQCPDVDILAHPGLVSERVAQLARDHEIFLEITTRRGHSLTNGHVAAVAERIGALPILDTDAHRPEDLITHEFARQAARGARLSARGVQAALVDSPRKLLKRAGAL